MDDKLKSVIKQWLLPFVLLLIVISGMTFNFRYQMKKNAVNDVTKEIQSQAKSCGNQLHTDLKQMRSFCLSYADLISNHETTLGEKREYLQLMKKYSKAYQVVLCDKGGNGINQDGSPVQLAETDYFSAIANGTATDYIYTADDGITGAPTVVTYTVVFPNQEGAKALLAYYSPSFFADYINIFEYGPSAAFVLLQPDGTIISGHGQKRYYGDSVNLWEKADLTAENENAIKKFNQHTLTKKTSTQQISFNGEETDIYYAPIGELHWSVAVIINSDEVTQMEEKDWKGVNTLLISLVLAMILFLGSIIVFNILAKIKNNEHNQSLEIKIDMDLLTELNNKLATERKIKEYLQKHALEKGMLMVMDIDNFKKINDTMGHAFGDEVLRTFGFMLRSEFRITDVVGRTGGDEFMVFLKNIPDRDFAVREATRIEKSFSNFQSGEYVKYTATASIGVAIFPEDGTDFESLYKAADTALYESKKRGKCQLSFYKKHSASEDK